MIMLMRLIRIYKALMRITISRVPSENTNANKNDLYLSDPPGGQNERALDRAKQCF